MLCSLVFNEMLSERKRLCQPCGFGFTTCLKQGLTWFFQQLGLFAERRLAVHAANAPMPATPHTARFVQVNRAL